MQRISIDPITRLEGHGKIDIFLDDEGEVANAYFQIPELRGFEKLLRRPAGRGHAQPDRPDLRRVPRGPPHGLTKALDALFHVEPPPTAKKLRELIYSIFFATDHTTHFYALGGARFHRRAGRAPSPNATSWASSTRSAWTWPARSSRCATTATT